LNYIVDIACTNGCLEVFGDAAVLKSTVSNGINAPVLLMQGCSAGDSAAYERRNTSLDDVVIVAALRTPLTKVSQDQVPVCCFAAFATRPTM
jgi:hypothetical protein